MVSNPKFNVDTVSSYSESDLQFQLYIWYKDPVQFFRDLYGEEPYPYQAEILRNFVKLRKIMILSGAGTGKTKLLACMGLWLTIPYSSIKKNKYSVIILAGSQAQSRALYEHSAVPLQNHPLLSKMVDGEILKTQTQFKNGSIIKALPLSLKSVQGQHMQCVIVDEAALVDAFSLNDTHRIIGGEAVYSDSKLIYSGTPTEYNSLFVEMWENRKTYPDYETTGNPLDWARFTWSAIQCPRFTPEEIEEKRRTLSEEDFEKIWMGKPFALSNTVIAVDILRKVSLGFERFKYNPDNKVGKILFGIDWGMTDKSVLVIIQLIDDSNSLGYSYRVIDVLKWKGEHYDNVHEWIKSYADLYKPEYIFVDLNPKGESDRCINKLMPAGHFVKAVNMGSDRSTLQIRMKYIFEHSAIIIPQEFQDLLENLKLYTWDKKTHDDFATALMLSLYDVREQEDYSAYYYSVGKRKGRSILQ